MSNSFVFLQPKLVIEIKMLRNTSIAAIIILIAILFSQQAYGKIFTVKVLADKNATELKLYVSPMTTKSPSRAKELKSSAGNVFEGNVPASNTGFYQMVVIKDGAQYYSTAFFPDEDKNENIEVRIEHHALIIGGTNENNLLSEYSRVVAKNGRAQWEMSSPDDGKLYGILKNYMLAADSLVAATDCNPAVKDYVKLWALTQAYNGVHNAVAQALRSGRNLLFSNRDVIGDYGNALDCSLAVLFQETFLMINKELPRNTILLAKFDALYSRYTNEDVLKKMSEFLISGYMTRHNYARDFDGGLAQLRAVVEKYKLDNKYIAEYEKRRATIKGAAFPADVVLRDAAGDVVDFSTFKGKYVYIDMWASWCVPCIKEVPYLQELEKELKNTDVIIISVSVDKNEQAWKKKMQDLGLHGCQLIDKENKLYDALNPKGVPFFVIYDKEGRLYMHDAPRPSDGARLKDILEGLK